MNANRFPSLVRLLLCLALGLIELAPTAALGQSIPGPAPVWWTSSDWGESLFLETPHRRPARLLRDQNSLVFSHDYFSLATSPSPSPCTSWPPSRLPVSDWGGSRPPCRLCWPSRPSRSRTGSASCRTSTTRSTFWPTPWESVWRSRSTWRRDSRERRQLSTRRPTGDPRGEAMVA